MKSTISRCPSDVPKFIQCVGIRHTDFVFLLRDYLQGVSGHFNRSGRTITKQAVFGTRRQ